MRSTPSRPGANDSPNRRAGVLTLAAATLAVTAGTITANSAAANPLWPGGPDLPSGSSSGAAATVPQPAAGAAPMANPPALPPANFAAPNISPGDGAVVGVAEPIVINFKAPVTDHATAEQAIRITSSNPVDGHFYWESDKQVRWRPEQFWPAQTAITVEAGGTTVAYTVGDEVIATADDSTHMITITRNGDVIKTMPTSMGKPGHETPNGTYYVGEKNRKMIMDSSTYGVPVTDPQGYKLEVEFATRLSYNGIFVHAAPWSLAQQGVSDTSHGCLNVSTEDAEWFMENSQEGDPVIVVNSVGTFTGDGMSDWN